MAVPVFSSPVPGLSWTLPAACSWQPALPTPTTQSTSQGLPDLGRNAARKDVQNLHREAGRSIICWRFWNRLTEFLILHLQREVGRAVGLGSRRWCRRNTSEAILSIPFRASLGMFRYGGVTQTLVRLLCNIQRELSKISILNSNKETWPKIFTEGMASLCSNFSFEA